MKSRGRVRAAMGACILGMITFAGPAFVVPAAAQKAQPKDTKKLDKAQLQEAQALTEAVESAIAGKAQPSDIPVKLESCFFFKASNGQTYIPFTVAVDSSKIADPNVSFMLRVIKKGAAPVAADKDKKVAAPPAAYQDLEFPVLKSDAGQAKFSRAFQVAGGDYDVWLALKEKDPADKKQKARITVLRQDLTVPDFGEPAGFATSSLVVADKMDQLAAPLKPEEQRENPYSIGQLQIVPKVGTAFAKAQELCLYVQVYNAALDTAKKPDVLIEYEFFQKQAGGEKKIFAADPTVLNAGTLPPAFDPAKHMLAGPAAWPLTAFPVGEYKLNVKVTDKLANKTVQHTVNFSVGA